MIGKVNYNYCIDDNSKYITLTIPKDVFYPTGTTKALISAFKKHVKKPGKLLDLGCGCGVVGIVLKKLGFIDNDIYASDVSKEAIACTVENAEFHNYSHTVKCGSLFEPWIGEKFDYIVNDVSGVAEEIAPLSPWFENVPCESGDDGTNLIRKVINQAPKHLTNNGLFFFPIISFSNVNRILNVAQRNFKNLERLIHTEWPLPDEMKKHTDKLMSLKEKGLIDFTEKFGMVIWYTDIYVGSIS